jgi:hypothetical protein
MLKTTYRLSRCSACGFAVPEGPGLRPRLLPPEMPCPRCNAKIETTWDHRLLYAHSVCRAALFACFVVYCVYRGIKGWEAWWGGIFVGLIVSWIVGRWLALPLMPFFEAFQGRKST